MKLGVAFSWKNLYQILCLWATRRAPDGIVRMGLKKAIGGRITLPVRYYYRHPDMGLALLDQYIVKEGNICKDISRVEGEETWC